MLSASYWPIILCVVATISPEIFERDKKFVRDKHTNLLIEQTSLMRSEGHIGADKLEWLSKPSLTFVKVRLPVAPP